MSAGFVFVSKFVTKESKAYKKYIDYIDREEAIRNKNYNAYNTFANYNEYMDDPEKTTGLFTDFGMLSENDKQYMKERLVKLKRRGA